MRILLLALLAAAAEAVDQLILPASRGVFYDRSIVNVCHPTYFSRMWTLPVPVETGGPTPPYKDSFRSDTPCFPVNITVQKYENTHYQIKVWTSAFMTTLQAVSYSFLVFKFPLVPASGAFFHQPTKQYIFPLAPRYGGGEFDPYPVTSHQNDRVEFWGYDYGHKLIDGWRVAGSLVSGPGFRIKIGTPYSESSTPFNVAVPYHEQVYFFNLKFVSGLTGVVTESTVGFMTTDFHATWTPYCMDGGKPTAPCPAF